MYISFIRPLLYHSHVEYDLYCLSNESFTPKEVSKKSLSVKEKSLIREKDSCPINKYNKRKRFNEYQHNNPISFRMISCKQWDVLRWYGY